METTEPVAEFANMPKVAQIDKGQAVCRGCGMKLKGTNYCYGGNAYHPVTGAQAKVNYYGGYVCSRRCDHKSSLELEQDMPGHGFSQTRIGPQAQRSLDSNWPEGA